MSFNPLQEKGIPLEKQVRNWSELNVPPYDKNQVDPYTQCRVITMNGIEVEGALFSHQFARHTTDLELKRQLAMVRRIEQQQQKAINWLTPGEASPLEVTIGYEQVAVDLTAWVAQSSRRSDSLPFPAAARSLHSSEAFARHNHWSRQQRKLLPA